MKNFIAENYLVVIALLLPFVFVIGVAIVVALQASSVTTNYNFVYATCGWSVSRFSCNSLSERFVVNDGVVEVQSVYEDTGTIRREITDLPTRLFIHEMPENFSREVTLLDLQQYEVSALLQSPDGSEVVGKHQHSQGIFPLFSTPSSFDYYLSNSIGQRKLNLSSQVSGNQYSSNYHFIGWIIN